MRAMELNARSSNEITARLVQESNEPFRHLLFENFFSEEIVWYMEQDLKAAIAKGLNEGGGRNIDGGFNRSEAKVGTGAQINQYGAYVKRIRQQDQTVFNIFNSRLYFNFVQQFFNFPFDGNVMAAIHHHNVGSPTGWIHSDYHNCNFVQRPSPEGINPWTPGTDYQYTIDPRPEILKCFRSVAVLYYFGNEPWVEGDGGETYLFRTNNWNDCFAKIPPRNNTCLVFEVTPASWHTFVTNTRNERNSVAMWFHSTHEIALQRFGVAPKTTDRPK